MKDLVEIFNSFSDVYVCILDVSYVNSLTKMGE
jgi:hypothetical protein